MARLHKMLLAYFFIMAVLGTGCSVRSLTGPEVPAASKILDDRGEVVSIISQENRIPVTIDNISPFMQEAIIAIEDSRFYRHHGIDPVGLLRAVYRNIRAGRVVEGGSTITQQLAKNIYLRPERTFGRKIKEFFLAVQLERRHTKKEILEMYLNQIYFGQGAYGVEAAARTYFNKAASSLGLAESAMLAGIPRAPGTYNPVSNYEAGKARQETVLDRMAELGMISKEKAQLAKGEFIQPLKLPFTIQRAPYFTGEVVKQMEQNYPGGFETLYSGGLVIYTTLDIKIQEAAERALSEGLKGLDQELEGALVALDPKTGQVKAMVGGKDYSRSQFNRSFAKIQPGSTFKPFLYAAAIDSGYTAGTTIACEPVSYPQAGGDIYQPKDFQGGYHYRPFTLKEALFTSDNVVSVKLNQLVGPAVAAAYAKKMGIESSIRPVLSLPLGTSEVTPLEMAGAFGTLANGGVRTHPYLIQKVTDRSGRILEEHYPKLERAIDGKTAYIITDMLTAVLKPGGTASNIAGVLNRPAAGKTGTSEGLTDAWFVGYTPDLVAAVYIGYDRKNRSVGRTGAQVAAPIWARFINEALKEVPPAEFNMPAGIVKVKICADDGLLAGEFSASVIEAAFVEGTEPKAVCSGRGSELFKDVPQIKGLDKIDIWKGENGFPEPDNFFPRNFFRFNTRFRNKQRTVL